MSRHLSIVGSLYQDKSWHPGSEKATGRGQTCIKLWGFSSADAAAAAGKMTPPAKCSGGLPCQCVLVKYLRCHSVCNSLSSRGWLKVPHQNIASLCERTHEADQGRKQLEIGPTSGLLCAVKTHAVQRVACVKRGANFDLITHPRLI